MDAGLRRHDGFRFTLHNHGYLIFLRSSAKKPLDSN
jgi:hypothetical protein